MQKKQKMTIQNHHHDKIKKICNHEAGHYVIARYNSFKTSGIKVAYNLNGHYGESGIEPLTLGIISIEKIDLYLEKRVQVLYAGAIAEAMDIEGNYNSDYALNEWRNGGSQNDYAKFRELIHLLRNIRYPNTIDQNEAQNQLDEIDQELISKTGELVTNKIELIYEIGNALFQKVKEYGVEYLLPETEINQIKMVQDLFENKALLLKATITNLGN